MAWGSVLYISDLITPPAGTIGPVSRWENGGPELKPKVTQPGINDGARIPI